jgi:ketosteroid isomerase-like protein
VTNLHSFQRIEFGAETPDEGTLVAMFHAKAGLDKKGEREMKPSLWTLIVILWAFTLSACTAPPAAEGTPPPAASASEIASTASDDEVEALITQLEKDWAMAIINRDVATLDRLLSEDFNGTSPTAHTYPKMVAIEDLKSGMYVVESMDLDDISVNVFGDSAVAFTSQEEKSKYAGKDFSGHYHYTDFWIKSNGTWQVVASHGSRFLEGH